MLLRGCDKSCLNYNLHRRVLHLRIFFHRNGLYTMVHFLKQTIMTTLVFLSSDLVVLFGIRTDIETDQNDKFIFPVSKIKTPM